MNYRMFGIVMSVLLLGLAGSSAAYAETLEGSFAMPREQVVTTVNECGNAVQRTISTILLGTVSTICCIPTCSLSMWSFAAYCVFDVMLAFVIGGLTTLVAGALEGGISLLYAVLVIGLNLVGFCGTGFIAIVQFLWSVLADLPGVMTDLYQTCAWVF